MTRIVSLAYGGVAYLAFLVAFVWAIGFVTGWLPRSVDRGPAAPPAEAVLVDLALLGAFALHHSLMARSRLKRRVFGRALVPIERSTYVLGASLLLMLAFWQWRPIPTVLWQADHPLAHGALRATQLGGFALVLYSSLLIDHLDLFGLRQVWLHFRGRRYEPSPFVTPSLYHWVRHPLYAGWLIAFWVTPVMTVGHALFAGTATAYILIAVPFEERDLRSHFGATYRSYRERTPMLIPRLRRMSFPGRSFTGRSRGQPWGSGSRSSSGVGGRRKP